VIRRGPYLIILLPTIIGHWNVSFVFLTVDSMICNPNIYSRSAEGSNNNLPLSFLSLYYSEALLLLLSD